MRLSAPPAPRSQLSALWSEAQELANESLNVAQAAWDAERAEDLKTALNSAQAAAASVTAELDAERQEHAATRGRLETSSTELVTVKARAEAQASVQLEQAERLTRVETELA